ncbi:methyltransferase domain-containing protein [Candidatus Fermentibacteria bacterium]|nr:methyltransferase domain-containing protein [Candidatus Fermentibacteria bacterium]
MGKEEYRLRRMATFVRGKPRVLDIGWTELPNTYLDNEEVVGLDRVEGDMPSNYSECVTGDATDLPEPFGRESFDALVAGEIIEHMERPVDFLRGCRAALSPGGVLVLSTPNPNSLIERALTVFLCRKRFYTATHVMLYPQRWLIRMLERAGFAEVELHSGGFPLPPFGTIPFPRPWCYQTIAVARKGI